MNPCTDPVTLQKGTKVAQLEPVDGLTVSPVMEEATTTGQLATTDSLRPAKKEILRQMVQDAESELTEMQSQKLLQLLFSYADVFADSQDELGHTNVSQHRIPTGDAQQICQAP